MSHRVDARKGNEGIRTSDSHTSRTSPRGAIFSPHGNCVRGCSRSPSSDALPEAGDGVASASGRSARPRHSIVSGPAPPRCGPRMRKESRRLQKAFAATLAFPGSATHAAVARATPRQWSFSWSPPSSGYSASAEVANCGSVTIGK